MNTFNWRRRLNFLLLGAVSGLLVALWQAAPPPAAPLLDMAPASVTFIEVLRSDQESLHFARLKPGWQMSAPLHGAANPILLQHILQITELRCPRHYPSAQLDLSVLQLDPPQLLLRLNAQELQFGTVTADQQLRYIQVGDTVHLCPDHFYALLNSAAASFLSAPLAIPSAASDASTAPVEDE